MHIRAFDAAADAALLPALAAILVEAVDQGASIGFMAGFSTTEALAFWTRKSESAGNIILIALDEETLLGTVTLCIDTPPNQPHRADVQKMIVARSEQRLGVGANLLAAVETEARRLNRNLLVLDTISDSAAARLYERCGWACVGSIANYALMPGGGLAPTTIYIRRL